MKIEYTHRGETPTLIINRKKGSEETEVCAFCGSNHIHGKSDGHRIPHCALEAKVIMASDGTSLDLKDGYIITTT